MTATPEATKLSPMHRLARFVGTRFNGVTGVDRLLRAIHHPDRRQSRWVKTIAPAYPSGPRYHLESHWFTEWTVLFYGCQDRLIHRWMVNNLGPDWVVFDIGANFGYYTCLMAGLCREVHSFEPVSWLADRMAANLALNGFQNVTVNRLALADRAGTSTLHLPDRAAANWGTSSLVHHSGEARDRLTVRVETLDEYCRTGVDRLDFIKLDVEGAENLVLRGGIDSIRRWRPRLIVELNRESATDVTQILRDMNYRLHQLDGREIPPADLAARSGDILALP